MVEMATIGVALVTKLVSVLGTPVLVTLEVTSLGTVFSPVLLVMCTAGAELEVPSPAMVFEFLEELVCDFSAL